MRIGFLLFALAVFACEGRTEPQPSPQHLNPAPEASLQAPLHPGWNPLLHGEKRPVLSFSTALSPEAWDSDRVWLVGDFLILWIGESAEQQAGFVLDLRTGDWRPISQEDAPPLDSWGSDRREFPAPPPPPPYPLLYQHGGTFVVRGRIVFLGLNWNLKSMATMFDPALNQWIPIQSAGMPSTDGAIIVPTEDEIIVWNHGKTGSFGARFDPLQNTWTPMSQVNAPHFPVVYFALRPSPQLWVGGYFVVWDGEAGAMYQPKTDTWTPMSIKNAPNSADFVRYQSKLFAWDLKRAAVFDPSTNEWVKIKMPKKKAFCGCGSFINPLEVWGESLFFTEAEKGLFVYDVEHNSWALQKTPQKRDTLFNHRVSPEEIFVRSFSPKETEAYKSEFEIWALQNRWYQDKHFVLEFAPADKDAKTFDRLESSQVWVYVPSF